MGNGVVIDDVTSVQIDGTAVGTCVAVGGTGIIMNGTVSWNWCTNQWHWCTTSIHCFINR